MARPPVNQSQVEATSRGASSASLPKHISKVDSVQDGKNQSGADIIADCVENANGRSIRSVFKASWGKTFSKLLGKQARPDVTLDTKPAPEPDAVNKKKRDFAEGWNKRFEELLNRSGSLKLQPSKSVTRVNVTSSHRGKNKGILKRRSLGNLFGSVRSPNTLKKGGKSQEALANGAGSSLLTQSLAEDPATIDSAPPILPRLPSSGDLRSTIQVNLKVDPGNPSIDPSAQHSRGSTSTGPHRRDRAVQTSLMSIAEYAGTKGEGTCNLSFSEMIDLRTGHELVWKTCAKPDAPPGPNCNTLASGSIAKPHLDRTRPEVTEELLSISSTNHPTVSTHTTCTRTRDLPTPRGERKQETRRSLKEDQVHTSSGREMSCIPAANNQSMGEASTSTTTRTKNEPINFATAGADFINMPSDSGRNNLKRKAKSLTFVRQLEIMPPDGAHTAPRRMSFKMDLGGTDGGPAGPKSSVHSDSEYDRDAAVNTGKKE